MMKNTLLIMLATLGLASTSFAFDGAYLGASGSWDYIRDTQVKGEFPSLFFGDHSSGFGLDVHAGYGSIIGDGFYVGGEAFTGIASTHYELTRSSSSTKKEIHVKSKYHYGAAGRVGYVFANHVLMFVKAGIDARHFSTEVKNTGSAKKSNSETLTGGLIGVGAEYKMADNVSFRTEYTYTKYSGSKHFEKNPSGHRFMAGVSYYFN